MFERHDQKTRRIWVYGHFRELLSTVLGFWGDFQGPWDLVHFWDAWPKTHHFCILGPFLWTIANNFGVLGWFTRPMRLSTFFRGVAKNSSLLRFWAVFMSYCRQFWASGLIYKVHDTQYIFEGHDKNVHHFCVLWPFSWATAHCVGVQWRFIRNMTVCTFWRGTTKKLVVLRFRSFLWAIAHSLGCRVIYKAHDTRYIFKRRDQNSSFLYFRVIFMSYCP
jgi:hypothetical protein